MACSMGHLGVFNPRKALLRVEINRLPQPGTAPSQIDVPVVCLQCDPSPCSDACPEEAIVKTALGAWIVEKDKCTGCGLCVDACQYKMIAQDNSGVGYARKCDLCEGNPLCVKYCPTKALLFC
jgi:carbon-monoxide dehydrogenase iron sulfur subunit